MDVEFLFSLCLQIKASAPPEFWTVPLDDLKRAYNGIGPEHWPQWTRRAVSALLRPFAAAALIHDWEYSRDVKSKGLFHDANFRLAVNIGKLAFFNRRPILLFYGVAAAILCDLFGYKAYCEGRLRDE